MRLQCMKSLRNVPLCEKLGCDGDATLKILADTSTSNLKPDVETDTKVFFQAKTTTA